MGRVTGFVICVLIGLCIFTLSLIADSINCSGDVCYMQSYISKLNINISEDRFLKEDIKNISCIEKSQPSRSGKKSYYVLILEKNNGVEYILGTYKKYPLCNGAVEPIKAFFNGKSSELIFNSGAGFSNSMGIILSVMMFFIGLIILTSKSEVTIDDYDEEDEEDNIN